MPEEGAAEMPSHEGMEEKKEEMPHEEAQV